MLHERTRSRLRRDAIDWASSLLNDPTVLYLDTETTGFGPDAEIVDVALVDSHGRPLVDTLVQPRQPIPAEATAIHGIDDRMVSGAPAWSDVFPALTALVEPGRRVIVYNAAFDARVIDQLGLRHGLEPLNADWQCAMLRYAEFAGQWNRKYGNPKWHKLLDAAQRHGIATAQQHRALGDALLCRELVSVMGQALTPNPSPARGRGE
jgi:DNA polymerase-3 subunit epsilon